MTQQTQTLKCPSCHSEHIQRSKLDTVQCLDCGFEWPLPHQEDGDQWVDAPEGYEGPHRWMNWHGVRVKVGMGFSPFFFNELEKIRKNIEACIIVVTGTAGSGKTYFSLRLAEIMDPDFDPEVQVPFGSDAFLKLISEGSPLKMGQVIIPDESQFTMGARNWYADIQKDLMNQIEAVRSKGYIIIIVALNMATLDVIARNYVITHLVHMRKRGEATVYKFYMPPFAKEPYKKKLGKVKLMLPGVESCSHPSCLRCPYGGLKKAAWARRDKWESEGFPLCMNTRARYERCKKQYLETMAQKTNERRARVTNALTREKALTQILPLLAEIRKTTKGRYDRNDIHRRLIELNPKDKVPENMARWVASQLDLSKT